MVDFYADIEAGVRPWVKTLRDAGINTECSCGHEGYIQCQVLLNPEAEIERIKRVLREAGLKEFRIEYRYEEWSTDGRVFPDWKQSIDVRSVYFKADIQESPHESK